ncbi:MAG: glycoside hydrolase family 130 protein [Pseudomonadota bacterium]|nr:glycoside hydrolase family 130 protein [Pseudomonadota bacterium]
MSSSGLAVTRTAHTLLPNPRRVIAKPYLPGEEIIPGDDARAALLMDRILTIPEPEVASVLASVMASFSPRHKGFEQTLERHFELVAHLIAPATHLSRERRLLIGTYFTHEYSVESAALFNPSMVLAPDQTKLRPGERRFVMSLRAVGEGHISSIEFRSGTLDAASEVTLDPMGSKLVSGRRTAPSSYAKQNFAAKLVELGAANEIASSVLARLSERFTLDDLEHSLALLAEDGLPPAIRYETAKIIHVLASSNYVTTFPADSELCERVIFPAGPNETRGMEDARFVRFVEDDGTAKYYATYTAFDGFEILPQFIETEDFVSFTISTLNGAAAQNKGMALFPRRIDGKYVMLARKDRENLYLAMSKDVRFWNDVTELHKPSKPWELLQIGNCGSPLETEAGWLVLTHGVGPMRRYTLSALLLDLADPRRVIGCLPVPLLAPDETEREGYVPNVLYSCGGLINGDTLVLPYGFSDHGINIALISVAELLTKLRSSAV